MACKMKRMKRTGGEREREKERGGNEDERMRDGTEAMPALPALGIA